ncbi:Zinc-binding domain, present in Dystrophin, CREB-binding protein [Teratosphaeria destructans]|uniref:Zinc-binding domain, present in Dystrophin, CREB-binding protein n=1 Tax=Teratosphaeria destructans TaxID=418781 RepID=A0A9W7SQI7_9PEZI|nr:Zinc-binding domain, present in Dystrophin, CREB-binding protein [Teratosphaeria destructans]
MAEQSTLTRFRPAALTVAGIAAAYGIYLLSSAQSSPAARTTLHRSNAVHRARNERSRPSIELGAPDAEAPLGRLTIRRGNNVLVTNLAQLRFPSIEQITTTFGPQFAAQIYSESVGIGLNAILLSSLRARSTESRQLLAQIGLDGLSEAVGARDEELCRAILIDAMPTVTDSLIEAALQCMYGAGPPAGGVHSAAPEIAETEYTSPSPGPVPADQGIKGLLYYIAEEDSKREAYEHRGITCEECGEFPIRGVRWHCLNCPDYDLCTTCEAHSLHEKTHVFVKIKIPLPVMSQPSDARPLYYPRKPPAVSQESLDVGTKKRLAQQYRFAEHKLDALYDQFMCAANVQWDDDPAKIKVAIDMGAFAKAMAPPSWHALSALSVVADTMFAFYDTNKDGLIGFVEFVDGTAYLRSPQRFSPLSRVLKCFDIDDDGFVNRADIMRILKAKTVLDRQMTRDAVARALPEKTVTGLNTLGSSQPISSIFHEEEIPQGEEREPTDKRLGRYGDSEPIPGAKVILDDTDPWPQQEFPHRRVRFADTTPPDERLRNFSSRFEELLHPPLNDEPRAEADTASSIFLSATDQVAAENKSSSLSVESDELKLKDSLARFAEAGLNQVLDPIFEFKERQFEKAKASREDRKRWRPEIDNYIREKEAFQEELRSLSHTDPLVATAVNFNGDLTRKRRPFRQPERASGPAFRGEIVATDAETLTQREREIAERPLEELLSATGYSIIEPNDTDPLHATNVDDMCVPCAKASCSTSLSDPTLPQNRPDSGSPPKSQTPSKHCLDEYLQHDEIEREAEQRGGPGRLALDELESMLVADRTHSLRGLILGWLELASF